MRLLAAIVIALFAFARIAVASHEAAYGSNLHYHDGQICAVSLHGDRHDHLDAPPVLAVILSYRTLFIFRPANAAARLRTVALVRRARAPPHHSPTA